MLLGIWGGTQEKEIATIENVSEGYSISGSSELNKYAVVYKNSEYVIVSPCYEKDEKLYIYKEYQIKFERKNQVIKKGNYKEIILVEDTI